MSPRADQPARVGHGRPRAAADLDGREGRVCGDGALGDEVEGVRAGLRRLREPCEGRAGRAEDGAGLGAGEGRSEAGQAREGAVAGRVSLVGRLGSPLVLRGEGGDITGETVGIGKKGKRGLVPYRGYPLRRIAGDGLGRTACCLEEKRGNGEPGHGGKTDGRCSE